MKDKTPVKIIFDTDMGCDCDDTGALALIHRLCDKGEAELLAVTHCFSSPYLAGCIDSINRFNKREVPVGINYETELTENGVYDFVLCEEFSHRFPSAGYKTEKTPPDTLTVLRKTLAEAEDGSVTFVVTGALTSMARLVMSEPDAISPLSGKELILKKISRTVVMGGRFFESWPMIIYSNGHSGDHVSWEWNIKISGLSAACTAVDEWPGELVFSSFEIGVYIKTMVGYAKRAKVGDPVARAYIVHNGDTGRSSWDHTASLEAVRPGRYWNYHKKGRISVDSDFVTHWSRDKTAKHTYLLPKVDYEDIRRVIDDLLDGK